MLAALPIDGAYVLHQAPARLQAGSHRTFIKPVAVTGWHGNSKSALDGADNPAAAGLQR